MTIISIYLFYAWVVIIHACFIGISAFAIWGKTLSNTSTWKTLMALLIPIVFLEFYWLPFAHYLELSLSTSHPQLLNTFQIEKTSNVIHHFNLFWYHPMVFLAGTILAYRIGRWSYLKNQKQIAL